MKGPCVQPEQSVAAVAPSSAGVCGQKDSRIIPASRRAERRADEVRRQMTRRRLAMIRTYVGDARAVLMGLWTYCSMTLLSAENDKAFRVVCSNAALALRPPRPRRCGRRFRSIR